MRSDAPMIPYKVTHLSSVSGPPFTNCVLCPEVTPQDTRTHSIIIVQPHFYDQDPQTLKSPFHSLITCLSSRRPCLDTLAPGLYLDPSTHSPRRLLGQALTILRLTVKLEVYPSFCMQALETCRTWSTAHVLTLGKIILAPWIRSI